MKKNKDTPEFIKRPLSTKKAYSMWLAQLDKLEQSTITSDANNIEIARENSMDIGFKLFPILESIAINLLGKDTARGYFEALGYSPLEADLFYLIFRNGLSHGTHPRGLVYDNGEISWGLMSSSGSSGFPRHFPGYIDKEDSRFNRSGDKAFEYTKLSESNYHVYLSLSGLVAHVKYDLQQRQSSDKRKKINFVRGQRIHSNLPKIKP